MFFFKLLCFFSSSNQLVEDEPNVHKLYWNAEQNSRKITVKLSYIMLTTGTVILPTIKSIFDISNGKYDTSAWVLPFFISVPFNTESILGWYLLLLININIGVAYTLSMCTITSYFISCCYYVTAICKHFDFMIDTIENDVQFYKYEKNFHKSNELDKKIKENLCKSMEIHNKVYE